MCHMNLGTPALLEPRLVDDLKGSFFVPDYQRGYRWGTHEVERLLDDIQEAGGDNYYLQPVVVKPMDDGRWELVDGQQRLTTLYLVMRALKAYMPHAEVHYDLSYETRPGSAEYLDDPREDLSHENIDYFHMFEAFTAIESWFAKQAKPNLAAIRLSEALSSSVFVIWYEAPQEPEFDSRALFTRLNVGRIPLTDAELVKASLLSRIEREHETAAQWDTIERQLWSPEVWAFAAGSSYDQAATRIELLLDTVADLESGTHIKNRPRFHTFEILRPMILSDPQVVWDKIVDLHSLILGWYEDLSSFHKVGYLVASEVATFFDLVQLAEGRAKSGFDSALDERIRRSLSLAWTGVAALTYGSRKTRQVLLLMNVETVRSNAFSSERYSFSQHVQRLWSLEHIHAQRSEGLNTVEQWTSWLKEHLEALEVLDLSSEQRADLEARIEGALPSINSDSFDALHLELVELFSDSTDPDEAEGPTSADHDEIDSIANLALLSRDDNSVLNNSVFEVKRRHMIELDQRGSYIPVCTRNVFLKYYDTSAAAQQIHFWGRRDREAYLTALRAKLQPYLLEDTPENDSIAADVDEEDVA